MYVTVCRIAGRVVFLPLHCRTPAATTAGKARDRCYPGNTPTTQATDFEAPSNCDSLLPTPARGQSLPPPPPSPPWLPCLSSWQGLVPGGSIRITSQECGLTALHGGGTSVLPGAVVLGWPQKSAAGPRADPAGHHLCTHHGLWGRQPGNKPGRLVLHAQGGWRG